MRSRSDQKGTIACLGRSARQLDNGTMLSEKSVKRFQALCAEKLGLELTLEEARQEARQFLAFIKALDESAQALPLAAKEDPRYNEGL